MTAVAEEASIFENEEWRVTGSGLEHKENGYFIAREGLANRRGDGLWTWPLHMAEKSWCAMAPFAEAFSCAAALYKVGTDLDLARTFRIARCEISAWPRSGNVASNPVPHLLRTLQQGSSDTIFVKSERTERSLSDKAFRSSGEARRSPDPDGPRSFSAHAPSHRSRFDAVRSSSLGWRAPRRIRRTGTKLVRLFQAAWNIK